MRLPNINGLFARRGSSPFRSPLEEGTVEAGDGLEQGLRIVLARIVKISAVELLSTRTPLWMTQTRSHRLFTTARSWEMKRIESPSSSRRRAKRAMISAHADIKSGHRLIGHDHLGLDREGSGNGHTLALAAGHGCGCPVEEFDRQAHHVHEFDASALQAAPEASLWCLITSVRVPAPCIEDQERRRVLEHHLDDPPLLRAAFRFEFVAIEGDGARIVALQTADDSGDGGFAGA